MAPRRPGPAPPPARWRRGAPAPCRPPARWRRGAPARRRPRRAGARLPGALGERRHPEHALHIEAVTAARILAQPGVAEASDRRSGRRRGGLDGDLGPYTTQISISVLCPQRGRGRRGGRDGWPLPDGTELILGPDVGRRHAGAGHRRRDPAHRRAVGLAGVELRRAAQDQPLAGPGHGHVEQAALLALLRRGLLVPELAVGQGRDRTPRAGLAETEPEAAVAPDPHQLAAPPGTAPQVRDADDLELQPLGPVDGHQAHGVEGLAFHRGLPLARVAKSGPASFPAPNEIQESPEIRARGGLELAPQPHQLTDVGQAPAPSRHGQHRQVVAGPLEHPLDQLLDPDPGRGPPLAGEPVREPRQPHPVLLAQLAERRSRFPQHRPWVAARTPGASRQHHQGIERDPDQRRGQDGVQVLLVARVGQGAEVGDGVDHLRMTPVSASPDHVGGDPQPFEGALVDLQVGGGPGEHHHVSRRRPGLDQLRHPPRQRPGLGRPPRRGQPVHRPVAGLVRDQQLHPRLARRRFRPPSHERHEPLAEDDGERAIDHLEDLPPGAEVRPQRRPLARGGTLLAEGLEQLDVGVAEGVDRLLSVADREQVPARDVLDQLELDRVGVLQLVDHHPREPLPVALPQLAVAGQQVARHQLQVLEVDRRALALSLPVASAEGVQQPVEQGVYADREAVLARRPERRQRLAVGDADRRRQRRAVAAGQLQRVEAGQLRLRHRQHLAAPAHAVDRLGHPHARLRRRPQLAGRLGGSPAKRGARLLEVGSRRQRRQRRLGAAAGAQLRVGPEDRAPERAQRVGGDQIDGAAILARQSLEGLVERAVGEPLRLRLVEDDETWIESRGQRVRPQDPSAEAVDGGDERALGRPGRAVCAEGPQPRTDPLAQLRRRLVGERDREDRPHLDAVVEHRAYESLHQHRGLAAAGARIEQQVALPPPDRQRLLLRPLHGLQGASHQLRQIPG